MHQVEFFTFHDKVMYKMAESEPRELHTDSHDIINSIISLLEEVYPEAHECLCGIYAASCPNIPYFKYLKVRRFAKCNFGEIDNIDDITEDGHPNLEYVSCPLRGECLHEGIICNAKVDTKTSPSEMSVLELIFRNMSDLEVAETLHRSIHTVRNHKRNAFVRMNISSVKEFISYAHRHKMFKI